jgi:hypothetical protein
MARSFASRFVDNLGFAYRKLALLISDDESDDGSAPTLTAGSAAPTASENAGSAYFRTSNGFWYRRIGGAWEAVLGAAGTLTANTISELTSAAGVTIDGLLLKDGYVAAADNQGVKFGNTAAAPDMTFVWDATKLAVTQGTANSAIHLGVSGAGIDLNLFGDTASAALTWDQSADALVLSGVTSIRGIRTSSATAGAITGATVLTLADSGGVFSVSQAAAYDIDLPSPTTGAGCRYLFYLTGAAANNVTVTVDGGAATFVGTIVNDVTSVIPATGSTLTFASGVAALGDSIEIVSISTGLYLVRAVTSANGGITVS